MIDKVGDKLEELGSWDLHAKWNILVLSSYIFPGNSFFNLKDCKRNIKCYLFEHVVWLFFASVWKL